MAEGNEAERYWKHASLKQRYLTARFHIANGMTHAQVAAVYGSSPQHVSDILSSNGMGKEFQGDVTEFFRLVADSDLPATGRGAAILDEVAAAHGLTMMQIKSRRRHQSIVFARQEAMYRLYNETTLSMPQVGVIVGGFDHTTVLHGCRAHAVRTGARPIVGDWHKAA